MRNKGGRGHMDTARLGNGPVGKSNPMSQKFAGDMAEFTANTRNPA